MAKKKISHLNEEFDAKLFAIIAKKNFYILIILMATALMAAFLIIYISRDHCKPITTALINNKIVYLFYAINKDCN